MVRKAVLTPQRDQHQDGRVRRHGRLVARRDADRVFLHRAPLLFIHVLHRPPTCFALQSAALD
eukprot:2183554-Prymnesium_polylepis.1